MQTIWNQDQILELLKDFYKIAKVRVGLFDTAGKELLAYPPELSDYCCTIRKSNAGRKACQECDFLAYQHASKKKEIYIYPCHAGLVEVVVPILEQGTILGYLMMGQFRLKDNRETILSSLAPYLKSLNAEPEHLLTCYNTLPVLDPELTKAYSHILQTCAAYVWMKDYIRIKESPLGYRVKKYLQGHLSQKILISDLMEEFGIGKTTLCQTIKNEFGMTIMELLLDLRITEARKLLENSSLSIAEIAEKVGIDDYNYFSRVFRRKTGRTPGSYRKAT